MYCTTAKGTSARCLLDLANSASSHIVANSYYTIDATSNRLFLPRVGTVSLVQADWDWLQFKYRDTVNGMLPAVKRQRSNRSCVYQPIPSNMTPALPWDQVIVGFIYELRAFDAAKPNSGDTAAGNSSVTVLVLSEWPNSEHLLVLKLTNRPDHHTIQLVRAPTDALPTRRNPPHQLHAIPSGGKQGWQDFLGDSDASYIVTDPYHTISPTSASLFIPPMGHIMLNNTDLAWLQSRFHNKVDEMYSAGDASGSDHAERDSEGDDLSASSKKENHVLCSTSPPPSDDVLAALDVYSEDSEMIRAWLEEEEATNQDDSGFMDMDMELDKMDQIRAWAEDVA